MTTETQPSMNGNFASGSGSTLLDKEGWIDDILDHGIDDETALGIESLLGKDTVLGNITQNERDALRILSKNIIEYVEAEHPPEDSVIQGPIRAAMLGSSDEDLTSLRADQRTNLRTTLIANELRLSRSVDGFQQKRIGEQRNVSEIEDHTPQENDDGVMSGITGLFS